MGMAAESERTFERPHRPLFVRLYDWLARRLDWCGLELSQLTEASILKAARREAKLSDFGDERFRDPLRRIIDSCHETGRLSPFGRLIIRRRLVEMVANRLKIDDNLRRHPEILDVQVRRPLLVTGLPRTGTTLLYNLLAQDPKGRPLLLWEATWPSPPPDRATRDSDPRIKQARSLVKQAYWLAPQLPAVHELNPDGPEECLSLTLHSFVSPGFSMLADVSSYEEWLRELGFEEKVAAYEYYRRQLQLLQWRCSADHWVLKSPVHLAGLDALLTVIPDACVVQTHRDPAKAIPSVCSLFAIVRGMGTNRLDLHALGARAAEICAELLDRATNARESFPDRVFDVHYADLVSDPIQTVHRIYERFGYERNDQMDAGMAQWLTDNGQDKHPTHRYDLAQFGLDLTTINDRFGPYCERFGLAPELPGR